MSFSLVTLNSVVVSFLFLSGQISSNATMTRVKQVKYTISLSGLDLPSFEQLEET